MYKWPASAIMALAFEGKAGPPADMVYGSVIRYLPYLDYPGTQVPSS